MSRKRILVVGVGSIGERHTRCLIETDRTQVAVCEVDDSLREDVMKRYSLSEGFDSLDNACEHDFDGAVICTPANLHISMAHKLVEKGCHVLVEKPLSISMDDVEALKKDVKEKQLVVGVAYVSRMNPGLIEMRQAIREGTFGEPVQIVAVSGQHFPFYRPAYREIYYTDPKTGGGAIQDALTHTMNTAEWLVGDITRLVADADHLVLEGVSVEDTVHVMTRHGNVMGSYSLNQHQAPNESTITVLCTKGAVRCEIHRGRWLSAAKPGEDWKIEAEHNVTRDSGFVAQAHMFLDAIEQGTPVSCSLEDAIQTLRVNLAVLGAVETGMWQTM